jgi:sporulation protein YlmC with PRC-barrel domain
MKNSPKWWELRGRGSACLGNASTNLGMIETSRDRFLIIKEKKLTNLPRSDRLERSRNPHDNFLRDRPVLDSNLFPSMRIWSQVKSEKKETIMNEPKVLAADTLTGDKVVNHQKEDLGKIEHLMIDLANGRIAYAVLSFGGFLGMGDKLFAIPWSALTVDTVEKQFILNVDKEVLKRAPGFDKDHWPNMADRSWGTKVFTYYGAKPYWD